MSSARVGSLLFLAAALQLGTSSLTAQHISVSLGENRKEVLQPSAQFTLPVLVDMTNADTLDLASLQLRVTWDTAVVGYASWSAGAFGSIEANEDAVAGGTFQASLLSTTGTATSFTAMNLTFDAGTAGSNVAVLDMLAAGSENGGDLLSRIISNSLSICIDTGGLVGDVTSGDLVDVIDAQQIARWVVDLVVNVSNRMRSHGDVNNDGQTNIVDAQQIARWAVELPVDYSIGDAIVLNCSDALTVSTTSLPTTGVGAEYSQQLNAVGAGGTYSWEINTGMLPAGLSLVGSTISGTPTATGTSEFTVKVTSGDGQIATRPLSIKVLPELSVTTASLPVGIVDTAYATTLTATGGDSTFIWSITLGTLPDGLTLSADTIAGTPTAAATSTFTVQAESGVGQTATKELSIVIHGTLSIATTSLSDGVVGSVYKDTLTATGGDGTYTWSVSAGTLPDGLTLSADTITGTPTATDTSTITLQVTSGDAQTTTKELSITVTRVASTVELSPRSLSFPSVSDTASLTATVRDQTGFIMIGAPVTWTSSDATKATVSSAGLVTAIANGTATITATSGSVSGTAAVTIDQVPSSVTLSPTSLSFASFGDTATITATVKDANDSTIVSPTVTWTSSDATKATVSSAGLVTSKGNGTATITATSGSVSTTGAVTVTQGVSSVTLSPTSLSLTSFAEIAWISATVRDANDSTIVSPTVTWTTSDATKATVSSAGLVTAKGNGTATITATSGSVSATAAVTVTQGVSSVTLSPTSLSFASFADTTTLVPTVKDANDSTIVSPTVTWTSSDATKATVSSAGLVTSKGNGTATITATSGSVSATAAVTVDQVASSVTLSPTSLSFASLADTTTLVPTVKDANDSTMVSPTVTWTTSDATKATASSAGLVTSKGNGTPTITATSGSASATAAVTVTQAAASITLSADSMDVLVSDTATITATVKDANDSTIANPTITWTTSSSSLATVSSAGLVTGVAAGTIQIAATHAEFSDTTTVTALVGKSGIISSNETWSTFIKLTDDVKVSDGVTLTINAGTVIKVTEGADIQVLVEGTILSQGTSGNEIVFRGASGSTEKSTWEGIKFRNTTHNAANQNGWVAGSKIEYTKVRNAKTGVYTYNQGLYVNNSEFKYNLEAIELRKTDSVYIANSTFTDNNYGVWTEYQPSGETDSYGDFNDAWFNDNTFTSNQTGILIGPNQRSVNNFNFTDNRFENNSSYGIQFGQGGYGIRNDGGAVTFTSNNFVDNGIALGLDHYDGNSGWDLEITSNGFGRNTTALRLEGLKGDTDITSNFFYLNTTTLTSSTQNQDFIFNENIVYQDVDVFLFPANGYQRVQPSITENLIDANSGKILDIKGNISVLTFEQNVVTGSTFGSAWFYNETSNNFTFSSNFIDWGASTEADKVYDGSDNFDYGTITFSNNLGSAGESTTTRSPSEYAALIAALALS